MNWKEYESEVFETLKLYYPTASIEKNVKKKGIYSHRSRQIDIYIEDVIGGKIVKICVECKYYNKPIDVKTVEAFISMSADIQADIGLMITEKGYSKTSLKRAYFNPSEIELDILSLAELKQMQGLMAFPYAGDNAALLLAPFGWVIDASKRNNSICMLYQRGLTFEEAAKKSEVAYINYWDRHEKGENLDDLLKIQEKGIRENAQTNGLKVIELKYIKTEERMDARTIIRFANIEKYPGIELTGFIEFENFIFFCVWFSNELTIKRNISKLKTMLKTTLPLEIKKSG